LPGFIGFEFDGQIQQIVPPKSFKTMQEIGALSSIIVLYRDFSVTALLLAFDDESILGIINLEKWRRLERHCVK
jgi:hypothetical protein